GQFTLASSVPAGASLGSVDASATNLQITGGNTITTLNHSASTLCNTTNDGSSNPAAAVSGCGSVPVVGTVTSITFNTSLLGIVTAGAGMTAAADAVGINVTVDQDYGDAPS